MKYIKYLLFAILLLISVCVSFGQIKLCNERDSRHPIDYKIFELRDSLLSKSVDTIIIYSHWIVTGSFNGYGKVIWKKDGETFLVRFQFHNKDWFTERQQLTKLFNDSMFSFFFENELDTINTNPTYERHDILKMSHDGRHFINIHWSGNKYCFIISNFLIMSNPENKRVQWINHFKEKGTDIYFVDGVSVENSKIRKSKRKK